MSFIYVIMEVSMILQLRIYGMPQSFLVIISRYLYLMVMTRVFYYFIIMVNGWVMAGSGRVCRLSQIWKGLDGKWPVHHDIDCRLTSNNSAHSTVMDNGQCG